MATPKPAQPSLRDLAEQSLALAQEARAAHRALYGDGLPYDLFPAHWAFVGPVDLSRAEFEDHIRRTYAQWDAEEPDPEAHSWDPDEVVLRCGRVVILYESEPVGREGRWHAADLRADGGRSFTAGELMYKFYRAAAPDLAGGDHQAFQGFQFVALLDRYPEPLPLYRTFLGG